MAGPWFLSARWLRRLPWLADGEARPVKHGPHRSVWRVALPDGTDVHVKLCRLLGLRGWLRQLLRSPKARLEYDRAAAVRAAGVATAEPLAWLADRPYWPSESVLVTRTIAGAVPLDRLVAEPITPRTRQRLAVVLGEFLARMHDAGLTHPDLHPGNLPVCLTADGEPRFYLLDLHAVRFGAPLGATATRSNLVMLNRWFTLRASRTDRLRFWRAYHRARQAGDAGPDDARGLESATWESNRWFWWNRDGRCRVTNRYYRRVRGSSAFGYAVSDLDRVVIAPLLADPDRLFASAGGAERILKDSRGATVALVRGPGGERWVYKRFRDGGWLDRLRALVWPTAAVRSWVFGHGVRERVLPTPRPLLVLHRRRGGLPAEGYLLTELGPGRNLLDAVRTLHDDRRGLLALTDSTARLIRDLHQRGLSHRDLKAANILVGDVGPERADLSLIDLAGVSRPWPFSDARRIRDLTRLNASFLSVPGVTRTLKLRFLLVYRAAGLRGRADWKVWWRAIAAATARKVAKNERTGRPLM